METTRRNENHETDCIEKSYPNDAELFLDAMRYNSSHGKMMDTHDKVHCLILGERLGVDPALMASALNISIEKIGKLKTERIGLLKLGQSVALKNTISHMAGRMMTQMQNEANDKLGGMNQLFYVNQIILLIENKLINMEDKNLMEGLVRLKNLMDDLFVNKK